MYIPNKFNYIHINRENINGERRYATPDGEKHVFTDRIPASEYRKDTNGILTESTGTGLTLDEQTQISKLMIPVIRTLGPDKIKELTGKDPSTITTDDYNKILSAYMDYRKFKALDGNKYDDVNRDYYTNDINYE